MQIKLGEKIRELRKRDGRTQEALADALGVTGQAVSRWEANGGYPDMEIIPAIANYFNVTIDELFGHHPDKKQKRYEELYTEYDRMAHRWENPDVLIPYLRNALAEFPGDEKLRIELADQLYFKFCSVVHGTITNDGYWIPDYNKMREHEGWEEAEKIMNSLLETSRDSDIRESCCQTLIYIYTYIGEYEKAKSIAGNLNTVICCREEMLESLSGEEGERQKQKNLLHYATWTYQKIKFDMKQERIELSKRIAIREAYLPFLEILFEGEFGFHVTEMRWLHLDLAELYAAQDNTEKVLYHLRKVCEYSKKFDKYLNDGKKIKYTSPFLNLVDECDPKHWTATEQVPQTKDYLETAPVFEKLRTNPEFSEILRSLEV